MLIIICLFIFMFILLIILKVIFSKFNNCVCDRNAINTMIVMGSGGHTSEMMALISETVDNNTQSYDITFIVSNDDNLSDQKLRNKFAFIGDHNIIKINRSRSVGQSYLSSIITTIISLIQCLMICYKISPQLIICNGPGVCIPICIAARIASKSRVCIVFVESFCRTESLSLSALIVYYLRLSDHLIVQWPNLANKYKRCKYIGLLV